VAHLPTSVGGNPHGLSSHLEKLGIESETWVFEQNLFQYPCTRIIWNESDGVFLRELKRWRAILTVAWTFDVIHFNYGTSWATPMPIFRASDSGFKAKLKRFIAGVYLNILSYAELSLYRLFRRPMFVHYQGDDARQGDFCLSKFAHSLAQYVEPGYYSAESDAFKRRMIRRMERYCHKLYAVNPDLMHVLGSKAHFVPYCHISLEFWKPSYPSRQNQLLRIGHAPSHRKVKGTDIILSTLNELAAEGHQFEVVLVEGLSNEEARRRYEEVDVMIDQLHAGWYGGLAVELMAMGRPVMVYIREEDLEFIPADMKEDLPVIRVTPNSLKVDIKNVLAMTRENIIELGVRSRRFVEKWHDPLRIAADIKKDYELALARIGRL
jgi:glycosyltransferase involved in cell wall biosynthesis